MTTGELISGLRESKGILQKDLAKIINVDPVVLNRIEKNKRPARGNEIKSIADYFNVSADYLLGRDNKNYDGVLSDEQETLLKNFDSLNPDGQFVLGEIIKSLRISHSRKNDSKTFVHVAQNTQNTQSDNNFYNSNGNTFTNINT